MKRNFLKFIAFQQICIMVVTMVISVISLGFSKNAIAISQNEYDQLDSILSTSKYVNREQKEVYTIWSSSARTYEESKYRIYVDKNRYNAETVIENASSERAGIWADDGLKFHVIPTEWAKNRGSDASYNGEYDASKKKEISNFLYRTDLYHQNQIVGSYYDWEEICISNDMIKLDIDPKINRDFFYLKIYKNNGSESFEQEMQIVIQLNKITLENGKNVCGDAIIKDDVMYVKPGATIKLSSEYQEANNNSHRNGYFSVSGYQFEINGNELTVPNYLGRKGTIYWENEFGSKTSMEVVTSNLCNTSYKIRGNTLTDYSNTHLGYRTDRTVGVKENQKTRFDIVPNSVADGAKCEYKGLEVRSLTDGISAQVLTIYGYNSWTIEIDAKKKGVIEVTYTDYLNNRHTENWFVDFVSDVKVSEEKVEVPETKTEDSGKQQSSSTDKTKTVPTTDKSTNIVQTPTYTYPEIYNINCEEDGDVIKASISIDNYTNAYCFLAKRNEKNKILYSKISTYNQYLKLGTMINNPNNIEISTAGKEYGEYDLYFVACNEYNEVMDWIAYGPFTLGYKVPVINKISANVTSANIVNVKGTIKNVDEAKYTLVKRNKKDVQYKVDTSKDYGSVSGEFIKIDNPSNYSFNIDKSKLTTGVYDLVIYARNGEDSTFKTKDVKLNLTSYAEPTMKAESTKVDESKGIKSKRFYDIQNCTQLKYKIVKRTNEDEAYSFGDISYEEFDGKVLNNPKEFTAELNAYKLGAGSYDVVIWAINKDSTVSYKQVWGRFVLSPNPILSYELNERKSNVIDFKLSVNHYSKAYYYVRKKDSKSDYTKLDVDVIKGSKAKLNSADIQAEFKSGDSLKLELENLGKGFYDITLYAENEFGATTTDYSLNNMSLADAPKLKYYIDGEERYSSYEQSPEPEVRIVVTDFDVNDVITVRYFTSEKDLTENGKVKLSGDIFKNENSDDSTIHSKDVKSNEAFTFTVNKSKGKDVSKYLYVEAKDKYDNIVYEMIGTIRVDDTKLELTGVYANKALKEGNDARIAYAAGEEFKLNLVFNKNLAIVDKYPDVFVKFGENTIKQSDVTVNNNIATYTYPITKELGNGNIELGTISFSNERAFKEFYDNNNMFIINNFKAIGGLLNEVDGKYCIDTTVPEITDIQIIVDTDSDKCEKVDDANCLYVSNPKSVKLKINYSEEVVYPNQLMLSKGSKGAFIIKKNIMDARLSDEYDITDDIARIDGNLTDSYFQGELKIRLANFLLMEDLAGNRIGVQDKDDLNSKIKYVVDGDELSNKIVSFDSSIYPIQMYTKGKKVSNGTYMSGTKFTYFEEFAREADSEDAVGIDAVYFTVYGSGDFTVSDKNDNEINPNVVQDWNFGDYGKVTKYILNAEQLPISVQLNGEGAYRFEGKKIDRLGNETELKNDLKIAGSLSIDKENSGLSSSIEQWYNLYDIEKEQQYTLKLKVNTNLTKDDIDVYYVKDSEYVKATYNSSEEVAGDTYLTYTFNVFAYGKLNIVVVPAGTDMTLDEKQEYLNDYTNLIKTFIPGDTNYDGEINVIDVTNILRYIAGINGFETEEIRVASDINGDGRVDVRDGILLARVCAEDRTVEKKEHGFYGTAQKNN